MPADTQRLAIIGCGFMGSAILQGLLRSSSASSKSDLQFQYTAHVNSSTSLNRLKQEFSSYPNNNSIRFTHGNSQIIPAIKDADIILLGFLPGDLTEILNNNNNFASHLKNKIIISMLAGISTSQLHESLQSQCSSSSSPTGSSSSDFNISRIIPTLSAKISESVTLIAKPSSSVITPSPGNIPIIVEQIFSRIGSIHYIPERLMDTATALGAAMHALAIVAVDSATDASVADGIPRATALALTAQCLRSCSGLMLQGGMTPESVKSAMSTPAGITLNSLVQLDVQVRPGIAATVRNAVEYTKSMNEG